jgi:hypothetical protein
VSRQHPNGPEVLKAQRLPALVRAVCRYAGVPQAPAASPDRFVLRCGAEPPGLFARMLEEASAEDAAEVEVQQPDEPLDLRPRSLGQVVVVPGFAFPCSADQSLRNAVRPSGGVLLFAVERHDAEGRLRGVTWAALPEQEPPAQEPFRAAVLRCDDRASVPAATVPREGR